MEALETGPCLWLVTDQNIFGIRIKNLEHLGKNEARDLKSIPLPPPFDFHLKLPKRGLRPFIFDSELFFAGCSLDYSSPLSSNKIYQLSYAGGTTLDLAEVEEVAGTIPEAPTLLYNCYVANIQGDVHLLVHDAIAEDRKLGFWVLHSGSGSKQWHLLTLPPSLRDYGEDPDKDAKWSSVRYRYWKCFVWKDKLFLMAQRDPTKGKVTIDDMFIFYVYDPQKDPWQQREHLFPGLGHEYHPAIVAVSSLGDVGNCNVALTWSTKAHSTLCLLELKIHALLVDNQDNCVRHQCLDELSEAIPSYFIISGPVNVNFIDLGEGKVCVLIGGDTEDYKIANQSFVFYEVPYMVDNRPEVPQSSFVFSFSKEMPLKHPYSQDSNFPRKEPKLPNGTNPINPRALLE
ncbi:hypothetical protein PIB30_045208 [Stylosanthes scabra]|uniref:Uncharacterized protein n=1 Tax=Stylosanthes scabra TaxID=79078 RepID=A0ABU6RGM4_9FABA|nr:hypothetical protein [Stylosanthes scabra]